MAQATVELKKDDAQKIEQEATTLVKKVSSAGQQDLDVIIEQIGDLGQSTQRSAGQSLQMLERPVAELMSGKKNDVSSGLLKLRAEVEELNDSRKGSFFSKLMRKNPLKNYIRKYQTVNTNVTAIVESLRNGKDQLEENTANMKSLKKDSWDKIYELQKRISFGQTLLKMLEAEVAKPENESKKAQLEKGVRKVVTRIESMTEMIVLLQQAIASTDIIVDNNDKLNDAVDNTIDKTQNLIRVSAMIQMAIQDQQDVITAVNATNKTMEDMFKNNASMLKDTTEKTTKLLESPAMSMEAIEEAMNNTFAALDLSEQSNRRIIDTGKEFITKLEDTTKRMSERLGMNNNEQKLPENKQINDLLK